MTADKMEALDFNYLLLEYYKKLRLSENELSVVLMIDHLLGQKNVFVTPDLLSMKMALSVTELDKIICDLMDRDYLRVEVDKMMKLSLKPLHQKLADLFKKDVAREVENEENAAKKAIFSSTKAIFEKELDRELMPLEKNLLNEWIDHGFTQETIVNALKDCLDKGNKTFKAIDTVLYQWQARDDIEKAGFTATSSKWDKDIEKTMEIAKAKWIDD